MKTLYRHSLAKAGKTAEILGKIKGKHLVFEVGTTRLAAATNLTAVAIDESAESANISFKRLPLVAAAKAATIVQGMTFAAATAGAAGNSITVALTAGATAGSEVVSVVGKAISVQIETGVSTRSQVKAALDGSSAAAALIDTSVTSGATVVTAPVSATSLAGGADATATENYDLADVVSIRRLRSRKWLIKINGNANPA